jgi:Tfp pilus assembly protein FimT
MNGSELESALAALDNMIDERNAAQQMVNILNSSVHRLAFERDEARREVCALEADTTEDRREYAKQRGWTCFPGQANNGKQDGMTDAEFLRYLAQNDYNIDGGLLADAVRLNEIADRIEKGHR